MAEASARATSAATNGDCGWLEAETMALRRRSHGMRRSGWRNMRVRCHALSRRTEMVSDTTRLPGAPEWRIPSHKQPQPSGHFVNLGWDSRGPGAYLLWYRSRTPLPLCMTPLPCSSTPLLPCLTPLPCSPTPLPCSPTPLPCSPTPLPCSPVRPHSFIHSFLTPGTYRPYLFSAHANKHNDIY